MSEVPPKREPTIAPLTWVRTRIGADGSPRNDIFAGRDFIRAPRDEDENAFGDGGGGGGGSGGGGSGSGSGGGGGPPGGSLADRVAHLERMVNGASLVCNPDGTITLNWGE